YNEVIGVREIGRNNIARLNRLGNWVINTTFNILFGTKLRDLCSGMYALKTDFAKDLRLSTQGFDVEVEIAAQAASSYSITDVQISYGKRIGERKLHPIRDGIKIFITTWRLARAYNPVLLYSSLAALTIFPALAILVFSSIQGILGYWSEGFALFGILLMVFSVQFMTLGIITAQQRRMEQRIINRLSKHL
ncbi:glycosyl transferase, partial [Candidatus Bathyarchaeota archaeon]|nr:glycosyl transferase [Candidatus Bathyarchaeota archaeon]